MPTTMMIFRHRPSTTGGPRERDDARDIHAQTYAIILCATDKPEHDNARVRVIMPTTTI